MTLWSRAGPNGIPGFSVGKNPGILENEIPGFFRDLLIESEGTFYDQSRPSDMALVGQNILTVCSEDTFGNT